VPRLKTRCNHRQRASCCGEPQRFYINVVHLLPFLSSTTLIRFCCCFYISIFSFLRFILNWDSHFSNLC
jgi:hypothetical protein